MEINRKTNYAADDSLLLDEVELVLLAKKDQLHKSILRVLAYEAQGFRIGLLFVIAFVILSFFKEYLPSLVNSAPSVQMMLLCIVCSTLFFADRMIFGRARKLSKEALLEAYSGNYDASKVLYRKAIRGLIAPPRDLYLLVLGETFALSGNLPLADKYIAEGMKHGASRRISLFYALRSRLFSDRLESEDLEFFLKEITSDPLLEMEMCWIHLVKGDYSKARDLSRKISKEVSHLHPSGIETRDLTLLVECLSNLFLGRSEIAEIDLDFSLKILKSELNAIPNLVPYISLAYLIRSRYYLRRTVTKEKGYADQERAVKLCRYPLHGRLLTTL